MYCPSGYYENDNDLTCTKLDNKNTINLDACLASLDDNFVTVRQTDLTAKSVAEMEGVEFTCQSENCLAYSTSNGWCKWTRKSAFQCTRSKDGYAAIKVSTNSLPNHCIIDVKGYPYPAEIEF